jgi:hypothetical protein
MIIFELTGTIENVEPIAIRQPNTGSYETGTEPVAVATGYAHELPACYRKRFRIRFDLLVWLRSRALLDGSEWPAELHWYEAPGIGKKEMKVKRLLD